MSVDWMLEVIAYDTMYPSLTLRLLQTCKYALSRFEGYPNANPRKRGL